MTGVRTFFPWYRRGFAASLTGRPAAGLARPGLPARLSLGAGTGQAELPVELAGPGDVTGIDPSEILRSEPYDSSPDFQPSCFPYVELRSPDLPWRFTPLGPTAHSVTSPETPSAVTVGTQLQPWIALVVIPADQVTVTAAAAGQLPVLSTTADQLPAAQDCWAWAHVQVTTSPGEPPDKALEDASRRVTRLICPRRLEGETRYHAFIVPTFAAGRAVLGAAEVGPDPLGPAWPAAGPVRLPSYFQWSFTTSVAGSFEKLAGRLRPRVPPPQAGGRTLDTSTPGWGADPSPDRTTVMQGALRPLKSAEPAADPELAGSLRAAISSSGARIELRPPIYGQSYQQGVVAVPEGAEGWLPQLNVDPRRRLAAGLAAWAVVVDQEDMVDQAWRQLAAAGLRSPAARSPELASLVATQLVDRYDPVTDLSPSALRMARLGGPFTGTLGARPVRWGAGWTGLRTGRDLQGAQTLGVDLADPAELDDPAHRRTVGNDTPGEGRLFAPAFAQPAYELLRGVGSEWLLPGGGEIPEDTVLALATNAAFVEAFLVGLNHSLAAELVWRGYPLDRTRTMFSEFWPVKPAASTAGTSIADWSAGSDLGSHLAGGDELVLLVKGRLVRQFPTATIYLARTTGAGAEQQLLPRLAGRIGPSSTFVGFPISPEEAVRAPIDGGTTWYVVLQESVHHPRFGVDEPSEDGSSSLASWQDLDWSHPHLAERNHVPVDGPLAGRVRPAAGGSGQTAAWGASSGHLAVALQQPAFRIMIPVQLWLTTID